MDQVLKLWILLSAANILTSAQSATQETLDYMARYMEIRYEVVDNLRDSLKTFRAQITLKNTGGQPIPAQGWVLYFTQPNLLEPDHYPYPEGVVLPDQGVRFRHIQGGLFSMELDAGFEPIPSGGTKIIRFLSENYSVARTDVLPNWYLAKPGLEPRTVVNTAGEKLDWVEDFARVNQWKRYDYKTEDAEGHDRYDPYTAAARYRVNEVEDLGRVGKHVLPSPVDMSVREDRHLNLLTKDWVIFSPPAFRSQAVMLGERLGINVVTRQPKSHAIVFREAAVTVTSEGGQDLGGPEAYSLKVDPGEDMIEITASDPRGAFYGAMTLLNLKDEDGKVPEAHIVDAPRYEYRGVMLDVARNFHPVADVLRLLDLMAQYKLNKLHLHLTDDEGWRIQIPGLEELTEVGGRRCHDLDESQCLLPYLGSGPTPTPRGSGYYTVDDYRDILLYAAQRHIQVIPEIDMPGHGHAAIRAMEVRRSHMMAANNRTEAKRFALADEKDTSRYKSVQMFTDNAINPCLSSTYTFVTAVVTALKEAHKDLMPLTLFHFGGDEVARGAWSNSEACKKLASSPDYLVRGYKDLKEYFGRQVSNITHQFGLDLAGWEDGVMERGSVPYDLATLDNSKVYAFAWDNVWAWGVSNRAYRLANAGFKVVMAQATHLYFDHPYEPDPEERGQYWATRFTSTRKTFSFMPSDLYANADVAGSGDPVKREELCGEDGKQCTELQKPENIAGMQGHLWCEVVRTRQQADYMLFPRLLALAERAWHEPTWERETTNQEAREREREVDWAEFANTLGYRELARLDRQGVEYRVPLPGAIVSDGRLLTNVEFPGLAVEYSEDGGTTWSEVSEDMALSPGSAILLRTRSASGGRYSRQVSVTLRGINSAASTGVFSLVLMILLPALSCLVNSRSVSRITQETLDYMARYMEVRYKVVDNLRDNARTFRAQITLKNTGDQPIPAGGWALYFTQHYLVEPDHYPYPEGVFIPDQGVSGGTRSILFWSENYSVARTDVLPNLYLAKPGLETRTVVNTAGEKLDWVEDFANVNQWKRYDYQTQDGTRLHDRYDPYTAAGRYEVNEVEDLGRAAKHVLPSPVEMSVVEDRHLYLQTKDWVIISPPAFHNQSVMLGEHMGISVVTTQPKGHAIVFKKDDVKVTSKGGQDLSGPEAYSLKVDPKEDMIEITASDPRGAFYGVMTLLNLQDEDGKVPEAHIKDAPRYEYRGMMLDVARNFHPVAGVLRLLDLMALYKLNKLHLHLTDDEGWRIQIPGLEELTEVGGRRCHDLKESQCLLPYLGSGPTVTRPGSGYYTMDDYKDILEHAAKRHIQVIPEIDMPGHAHAAIRAMEVRKSHMKGADNSSVAEAKKFALADEKDTSSYKSVQMFTDNAINPCLSSTYTFVTAVVTALKEAHKDLMPLTLFHFGGDEVARGAWKNSEACKKLTASQDYAAGGYKDLKEYFVRQVSNITHQLGLDLGAWEDGVMEEGNVPFDSAKLANSKVYGYAWNNVWSWGVANRAYRLANAGFKVVMAQATHLYFDHPHEPDPEERGLYWATRFTSTRKTFSFMPTDLYANADFTRAGEPVKRKEMCGEQGEHCTELKKPENIAGMQGELWGETVRTQQQCDSMLFPRVLALAERAWHEPTWERETTNQEARERDETVDWAEFANTLGYRELARLDRQGVEYRVPLPGAIVSDGRLLTNVEFPGLAVEYSEDGTRWSEVSKDMTLSPGTVFLRTRRQDPRSQDGRRVVRHPAGETAQEPDDFPHPPTTFSVPTSATRTGSPHTQGATTAVRPSMATSPVRTSSSLSKTTSWSSSHFGQRATTTVRPSTATSPAKTPTSPSKTTSSSSPARCGQRATRPARPSTATSPPKTQTSPSKMTSSSSSSHPGQRMTTAVRPSTATSPFKTPTSLSKTRSSSSSAHSGQKARTTSSSSSSRRPSTAASITKVPGTDSEQRSITSRRRSSIRCQSASSHSPNADDLERVIPRRSSSAASLTLRVKQQHPETRAVTATSSGRRFSAGSVLMMNSSSASPDHGHRGVSWSGLASPTSPAHSGIHGPRTPTSPSWLLGPDRPRSLQRRASTRSFLFSKSSEVAAAGRPLSQRSPIPAPHSAPGRRDTRKLFYNAGLMALHTRRISGGSQRGRRESSAGQGQGRRSSSGHAGRRQGSGERLAQITSVVKIMALHRRVQARKIKRLWGKVRLWTRIICVLASMLRKYAAAAMEDPSSPFYSHTPGNLVPDLVVPAVDKDHYMFFDPAFFKANRQRRMSQEVQKILTKASDERTPEELNHAMIGLRDIPQLAVFPVRMQKNLAQFGHFQCLPAKRMVLKQGHSPEGFYIILYGNVAVAVKNEETGFVNIVVELPRGESFGELSIVSGGLRNSSVLTTTYTELLCISKAVYQTIFAGGVRNIDDPEHTEFVG
ncbi:uncharacterized protein LOC143285315 [Babylonia areolata]|uniref:uncharacterized protein LOC143285315 n=1 Tax=Babylonia areolata TaxID=304850 RepID=UPI003FD55E01